MPKRLCVINLNFKYADKVWKIFYTICKLVFSIEHGGLSDTKQHTTKVKIYWHFQPIETIVSATSKYGTDFFFNYPSRSTDENIDVSQQKGYLHFIFCGIGTQSLISNNGLHIISFKTNL